MCEIVHDVPCDEFVVPEVSNTHRESQISQIGTQTNNKKNIALDRTYETISFPFKWEYAKIVELSQEEKEELNRPRRYHKKMYKKPCALCGEQGVIEFKKKSNGNVSIICRECAEEYVRNAKAIQKGRKHEVT